MVNLTDMSVSDTANPVLPPTLRDLEREEVLARRFARKNIFQQDLVLEFTRDAGLLHQYYQIRKNEYDSVYGKWFGLSGKYFHDGESDYDRNGHILIARTGNFCIGGVRLNIKSPRRPLPLPTECDQFKLADYFPQLIHKQLSYCQISGFSLLPEFRGGELTCVMSKRAIEKAIALNVDVMFADASLLHARVYQRDCAAIGFPNAKVHFDINSPDPDMKRVICSLVINPELQQSFYSSLPAPSPEKDRSKLAAEA